MDELSRLRELAGSFPEHSRPVFVPPASPEAILAFEQALGIRLTDEVREFLLVHDAIVAMNVWNGYWIGGTAELTRSVVRGDFPSEFLLGEGHVHLSPIATDGGGNAFLIAIDNGSVCHWEHETGSVSKVADSFTAFLGRVAEDWKHAAVGDEDWHYLV
jgi:hypothetical protein